MTQPLTSRNWLGKASAGFLLGLAIAIGISNLLAWALSLKDTYFSLPGQFTMWMISPIWCGVLSFCFLFRTGARAWAVLGIAAAAIWTAQLATGMLL
jgi:hypothetical protein